MTEILTQYAVPVLLALMGICLIAALAGLYLWYKEHNGSPQLAPWAKFSAGVSYLALGLCGIIVHPFFEKNNLFLYIFSWLMVLLGGWLFKQGLKLRRQAKNGK
jgi:hypothetical protein